MFSNKKPKPTRAEKLAAYHAQLNALVLSMVTDLPIETVRRALEDRIESLRAWAPSEVPPVTPRFVSGNLP